MATRRMIVRREAPAQPANVRAERASGYVSAETRQGREVVSQESRQVDFPPVRFGEGEQPAYVRVGTGHTINMGDFASLRLDVSITMPCLPEDVDATYTATSAAVGDLLAREFENYGIAPQG